MASLALYTFCFLLESLVMLCMKISENSEDFSVVTIT